MPQLPPPAAAEIVACKVFDCDDPVFKKDLCSRHFYSLPQEIQASNQSTNAQHQREELPPPEVPSTVRKCHICGSGLRSAASILTGICSQHYQPVPERKCAAENCGVTPRNPRDIFCYQHDLNKQKERNAKKFLKNIDKIEDAFLNHSFYED